MQSQRKAQITIAATYNRRYGSLVYTCRVSKYFELSCTCLYVQDTNVISESQISLEDFNILKVIGRGSYAKVLMVELKSSKEIYAMKVIKKSLVMDEEVITSAISTYLVLLVTPILHLMTVLP